MVGRDSMLVQSKMEWMAALFKDNLPPFFFFFLNMFVVAFELVLEREGQRDIDQLPPECPPMGSRPQSGHVP